MANVSSYTTNERRCGDMPTFVGNFMPAIMYNPEVMSAVRHLPDDDVISDMISEVELPDMGSQFWPYH